MHTGSKQGLVVWIVLLVGLAVSGLAYLIWFMPQSNHNPNEQNFPLRQTVNECDGITEKAALALPPAVVEFQKLEYAGRKARVFKLCMHDRGYQENAAWTQYATPLAQQHSSNGQISVDEAIENLRRADMVHLESTPKVPEYWVLISKQASHAVE
ncbi:MAG TPA: hypothetical protein VK974_06280 [Methylophilaceae bacterium]|nr:hypothetical protein [Methylophilaceae bacterium]